MIEIGRLRKELATPAAANEEVEASRDAVVEAWERATDRLWTARTAHVERVRDCHERERISLRLQPATTITSVEERTQAGEWTATETTDFELVDGRWLERTDGRPWKPIVRVTYDGGYTADTCPAEISRILVVEARFQQARQAQEILALGSQAYEAGTTSYLTSDNSPAFKKAAKRYRRLG